MWVSAEEVARVGVDGMAAGRDVVIPGTVNRVGAVAANLMPKRLLVPLLARQHPSLREGR
jgi:short-subunit dehydrogenase